MISLHNLNRQHNAIKEELNFLDTEIAKEKQELDTSEIAFHMSKLTALFRIHLLEDDLFLYPYLLNCKDDGVITLTNLYIHEMGNIVDEYTIFNCRYHIEKHINDKIEEFLDDAKKVLRVLKERFEREEKELYSIVKTSIS
ncbi:MAG: Hemerythrin cation binding domain protein [Herbinix sp.]|jgi:hypothetical protein|nr:Hemerythrin cation binding domain protein [Herbinix sp.]